MNSTDPNVTTTPTMAKILSYCGMVKAPYIESEDPEVVFERGHNPKTAQANILPFRADLIKCECFKCW